MEPKLGDFGLSRDGQLESDGPNELMPMIASHIKGTLAYLPPEFTTSKIITTKLDVYSFGVVLLEVATGQRAYSNSRTPQNLVEFAVKNFKDLSADFNSLIEILSDKRTPDTQITSNKNIFIQIFTMGINCTNNDRFNRPTFTEIFGGLN